MALCNPKTLRGIFGAARKMGLEIEDLRAMTSTGRLSQISEREAAGLLENLRAQERGGKVNKSPWRLYSVSTLAREIRWYASIIRWQEPGGFRTWLKKYFDLERLEWVDSFKKATNVKNALKRMYNEQKAAG